MPFSRSSIPAPWRAYMASTTSVSQVVSKEKPSRSSSAFSSGKL